MTRQLTRDELRRVRRSLKRGVRHVRIAQGLGISMWLVARIASDRRLRYRRDLPDDELPIDDPPPGYEPKNLKRCPQCGGLAYLWPCMVCKVSSSKFQVPGCSTATGSRS